MFKQLSKGLKKFIYLHAILLFLLLIYSATVSYCSYMGGLMITESKEYFGVRSLLMFLFIMPFLLVIFIYYIIILFKIGKKFILPSIVLTSIFFGVFLFTMSWSMVRGPVKGYYDYVKNNVDIDKIHQWLVDYKGPKYNDFVTEDGASGGRILDEDWPKEIKALNPSRGVYMYESDGKKYIRISHGVDMELSIGLCVMEEPMDVPGIKPFIKLQDNAFIWAGN